MQGNLLQIDNDAKFQLKEQSEGQDKYLNLSD